MHSYPWARFAAFALLPLTLVACGGGEATASPPPQPTVKLAALQPLVAQAIAESGGPGAQLSLREPSGAISTLVAGRGQITPAVAMGASDHFRAGSVLKLLVATVTLQLVEEGRLSLDATLDQLLPAESAARFTHRDRITLRSLLNHTSGIPNSADTPEHDADVLLHPGKLRSVQDYLDTALQQPQQMPGRHAYANTNYMLIGLIIERSTGRSWRTQLRERLLERLAMRGSSLPEPSELVLPHPYARGYQPVEGQGLVDTSQVSPSMAGAAGGHALITTTQDLARFAAALFGGELYRSPATLQQMLDFVEADPIGDVRTSYGLGVTRHQFPDGAVYLGHGGSTAGYSCAILYDTQTRYVAVGMLNQPDLGATYMALTVPVLVQAVKP